MSSEERTTDRYLTVTEVATTLNVVERTVTEWLNSGRLMGWKTGRRWMIPEASVTEYLNSVQPPGVEPPSSQILQKTYAEVAHQRHISDLLKNLQQLRNHVGYLNAQNRYRTLSGGIESEINLPRFTRIIWLSIEQHLVGTSVWDVFNTWKKSALSVLRAERSVMQISRELGERKFGILLLDKNPNCGGRLTTSFSAAGVSLAAESDDPEIAFQSVHLEWKNNELIFNYSTSMIVRLEISEVAVVKGFRDVMGRVITSKDGAALRDASKKQAEVAARLEDELDGISLSSSLPGKCNWCSAN